MAIVNFSFDHNANSYAEGAYCPLSTHWNLEDGRSIILWETHKGLCISEREANYYDDSDFYMTVWDEEKNEPKSIIFATTRGWTYPALNSYVDATEEVIYKYKVWKKANDRKYRIIKKWNHRKNQNEIAYSCGLTRKQVNKLQNCLNDEHFTIVCKLLKTKNFRSKFRASCADQIRKWIAEDSPKYATPLSKKQFFYL